MPQKTTIEWCDRTSNPIYAVAASGKRGWYCTKVSPGCDHCYSEALNRRWGNAHTYTKDNAPKMEWKLNPKELQAIIKLKGAHKIFLCDMTDLFHADIPNEYRNEIFDAMLQTDHIFQLLTKRPKNMQAFIKWWLGSVMNELILENIWLGVSVESQDYLWRIDTLCETPAVIRFVSFEPLLGEIRDIDFTGIDWCIIGAESGAGARPMAEEWARTIKDQAVAAGVKVFYKQDAYKGKKISLPILDGRQWMEFPESEATK